MLLYLKERSKFASNHHHVRLGNEKKYMLGTPTMGVFDGMMGARSGGRGSDDRGRGRSRRSGGDVLRGHEPGQPPPHAEGGGHVGDPPKHGSGAGASTGACEESLAQGHHPGHL